MKKPLSSLALDVLENSFRQGLRITKTLQEKKESYTYLKDQGSSKNPLLASTFSVVPGIGQIYLGQGKKGKLMLILFPLYFITIPFGMIDAYVLKKRLRNGTSITPWECFWNRSRNPEIIWEVFDILKKGRHEEHIGVDERIIDNSKSSTTLTRDMAVTREWSYSCAIEHEKVHKKIDTKNIQIKDSVTKSHSIEDIIRNRSVNVRGTKHIYEENIHIEIPPSKKVRLLIQWKNILETGVVQLKNQHDDEIEIPFALVVGVTFDQALIDE